MIYTKLLKDIWSALYNPQSNVDEIIEEFFHQDYEQCINGVIMNRNDYVNHVIAQKKNMIVNFIDFKRILEKGSELFAIYYPQGININNDPIKAEVIAYFQFENQKIIRIHGQVRLITGNLSDADM